MSADARDSTCSYVLWFVSGRIVLYGDDGNVSKLVEPPDRLLDSYLPCVYLFKFEKIKGFATSQSFISTTSLAVTRC